LSEPTSWSAAPGRPGVRAVDQLLQVHDQVRAHRDVMGGGFGVMAHDEPLGPRTLVAVAVTAGGDGDLLDPQVVGDGAVAAGGGSGLGAGSGSPARNDVTNVNTEP
jgi:hypothetical protein